MFDILSGHAQDVSAVHFTQTASSQNVLFSGSVDGEFGQWLGKESGCRPGDWTLSSKQKAHDGTINAITSITDTPFVLSAGADAVMKLWRAKGNDPPEVVYALNLKPRYIPLSVAAATLTSNGQVDSIFVAVAGTKNSIQIYVISGLASGKPQSSLRATLPGHEGWITNLKLRLDPTKEAADTIIWLASASQDKSVRIWKICRSTQDENAESDDISFEPSLSAKTYRVKEENATLAITFEALLLGHEDWIQTASWNPQKDVLQLLTSSADNSLIIWEPDPATGIWLNSARLGEISGQKGSTSATGSTGGFWIGLWSPKADAVTCLGRTGSWRLWLYDQKRTYWVKEPGITGHTKAITDISWSRKGEYLLSTSTDQTTRLHAPWTGGSRASWHEFCRPQIHGYDLNCIQSLSKSTFVSGADEKLLRVFEMPKQVGRMLEALCGIALEIREEAMPEAANMPVLGLSNKAVEVNGTDDSTGDAGPVNTSRSEATLSSPPTEDYLAKHTLWPEYEKLYGHGHEISALAADSSGSIIATACKASSAEHAVIRIYDAKTWHEIRPPLVSHSLTITRLQFQANTGRLLSVGRDRKWTVFQSEANETAQGEKKPQGRLKLVASNPKGHSRMILDAAWSPVPDLSFFVTASRDKTVKVWRLYGEERECECVSSIARTGPVTAVNIQTNPESNDLLCLAVGEESGRLSCHVFSATAISDRSSARVSPLKSVDLNSRLWPSKSVTRLQWQPGGRPEARLAVASADSSLRILSVDWQSFVDK